MKTRIPLLIVLVVILAGCYDEDQNLARHYDPLMSMEERQKQSYYDWDDTKVVSLVLETPEDGLVKVRAVNGEILFEGYIINGVLAELKLNDPEELDQILIEYDDSIENVSVGARKVHFAF